MRITQAEVPRPSGSGTVRPVTRYAYYAVGNRVNVTDARGFTTTYGYDQLNRITKMDAYTGYNAATPAWGTLNPHGGEYKERIAYDGNGNILKYLRNGNANQVYMDSLNYFYNRDGSGNLLNNRLRHVKEVNVSPGHMISVDAVGNEMNSRLHNDACGKSTILLPFRVFNVFRAFPPLSLLPLVKHPFRVFRVSPRSNTGIRRDSLLKCCFARLENRP